MSKSMNYSYHCKHCGHTVMSNHKPEIRLAKEGHRVKQWALDGRVIRRCQGMVETKPGYFARVSLVGTVQNADR
jgi:hypothetical protein